MNILNRSLKSNRDIQDVLVTVNERNRWTPDATALESAAFQLVFLFDRLQPGFKDYDKLIAEHCVHGPIAFTEELFVMQKSRLGSETYPVIQRKNYHFTPPKRIKGQLVYLQSEEVRNLDCLRKNGVEFQRELINILVPYRNVLKIKPASEDGDGRYGRKKAEYKAVFGNEHPSIHTNFKYRTVSAYAYVGIDEYWDDLISPIQWSNCKSYLAHNPEIGGYYHFTKRELFDE